MVDKQTIKRLVANATVKDQFKKQLERVARDGSQTQMIASTVEEVIKKLAAPATGSIVIYGDPQSGKTEMMICLTARLLDEGKTTIVHLMNDSVDLLMQNLDRFKLAGLAPAPKVATDLANSPLVAGHHSIVFCKKNASDLQKLVVEMANAGPVMLIDDEADFATPNSKVNTNEKTRINDLVSQLLGTNGVYIGVTATPARLNLNNTFNNKTETWVNFPPHGAYTGHSTFFPTTGKPPYRLTKIKGVVGPDHARKALARFLITVAYLNKVKRAKNEPEQNYSFLVHTSGKTVDHIADRNVIESAMKALVSKEGDEFEEFVKIIYEQAKDLYPKASADDLSIYVIENASRSAVVVLNSKRDRASAGDKPTAPTCPFTVIIGGNIVSRGVTFPNLLAMFFTRDVKTKLQQDTYIQRARMFGARGKYLEHFELTIPERLYGDWHRCFVLHRLALQAIKNNKVSPVWIGDDRISIAATSSIDRGTVDLNKGEMSFQIFAFPDPEKIDRIIASKPTKVATLRKLAAEVGEAMPQFLIDYIEEALKSAPDTLAIHTSTSIKGQSTANQESISRTKGFIGNPQLELGKFPNAVHHVKIFHNGNGNARVFYKNVGGVQFVQNLKH